MSILDTAKYTEWGQKYHFADVLTANDWRQRLPVQDYESTSPPADRASELYELRQR